MFKFLKSGKIVGVSDEPFRGKIVGNSSGSCKGGASIDEQIEDTDHTIDDYIQVNGEYVLTSSAEAIEQKKVNVRAVRNSYLEKYVDPKQLVLVWNSLTTDEQKEYTDYRRYLLDYPETEDWYKQNPLTFEEWESEL